MEKVKLTGKQYLVLVAVISMYFFAPTQGIISSVLAQIGETYTDVAPQMLTYLVSINNLCAVFTALLFSFIAGRKVSHRAIGIIALLLFVVGGGAPAFFPDSVPFGVLLFSRAVMGLGRGCFIPIIQTVFCDMFHNETARSAWFGIGSIFFNIGATTGTTIAGALGLIDWHRVFIFYLFAIIPLVLFTCFYKEPASNEVFKHEKIRMPGVAWAFCILYSMALIVSQMLWNYASSTLNLLGINSLEVGTILSMFTIAAMILAVMFALVYKLFKSQVCAAGIAVMGLGHLLIFVGTVTPGVSHVLFYAGAFLIGFGCNIVTLGVPMILSMTVPAAATAAALGFAEVFHNLGAFLSSPFSQVVFAVGGQDMPLNAIFLVTAVFSFVMAGLGILVGFKAKGAMARRAADDAAAAAAEEAQVAAAE